MGLFSKKSKSKKLSESELKAYVLETYSMKDSQQTKLFEGIDSGLLDSTEAIDQMVKSVNHLIETKGTDGDKITRK